MSGSPTDAFRRADAVFDAALDLPAAQRAAFVAQACASDSALRHTVDRLLRAHDRAAGFLEAPLAEAMRLASPAASPDSAEHAIPPTLGPYRVMRTLGRGGMGIVFLAAPDEALAPVPDGMPERIALKVTRDGTHVSPSALRRFLAERRILASLDHPNIARLVDAGVTGDGSPYLAMEFCERGSLAERLARNGATSVPEALAIARQIASALAYAHAHGVVHRDVKPGNVLFDADDGVRLSDFGIAKILGHDSTRSGVVLGTAAYLAPEQVQLHPVDHRADLWALGVVLYEMLAGRRPFDGEHDAAVAYAIVHEAPPALGDARRELPKAADDIVCALLQKDPARRPTSAADVEASLDAAMRAGLTAAGSRRRVAGRWAQTRRRTTYLLCAGAIAIVGATTVRPARHAIRAVASAHATARPRAPNPEAYQYFLRGREFERQAPNAENFANARIEYMRALSLDPSFALASARLSVVLYNSMRWAEVPSTVVPQVRSAAESAVRLDPRLGDAHLALGNVWVTQGRPDSALVEYGKALTAMPNAAEAHMAVGVLLREQNRWEDALRHFEHAARLDPWDPLLHEVAYTQSRLRHYAAAIQTWDHILALSPSDHVAALIRGWAYLKWTGKPDSLSVALAALPPEWDVNGLATWGRVTVAHFARRPAAALAAATAMRRDATEDGMYYRPRALLRGQALADLGDTAHARAELARASAQLAREIALHPRDARRYAALGLTLAALGERARASAAADSAMTLAGAPAPRPLSTAMMGEAAEIRVRIGDVDGAIALLAKLVAMPAGREISAAVLRADPTWDPLRTDARFERLRARVEPP